MRKILCAFLAFTISLFAEDAKTRPQFKDYSVEQIYRGSPAAPKLITQGDRMFRTMIRNGAKADVDFAGHYTVPSWGCGTECDEFVIVDSITGTVFDVPFSVVELPGSYEKAHGAEDHERMEFHPDSRLLKLNMCPNEKDCGFYDYVMVDGKGLRLIHKQLLPKQYQTE
jgi:hypothetical protein